MKYGVNCHDLSSIPRGLKDYDGTRDNDDMRFGFEFKQFFSSSSVGWIGRDE